MPKMHLFRVTLSGKEPVALYYVAPNAKHALLLHDGEYDEPGERRETPKGDVLLVERLYEVHAVVEEVDEEDAEEDDEDPPANPDKWVTIKDLPSDLAHLTAKKPPAPTK